MSTPNTKDCYGALYDNQGRNYSTSNGERAVEGQLVNVNDGYGNFKPGTMNQGTATPFKQD